MFIPPPHLPLPSHIPSFLSPSPFPVSIFLHSPHVPPPSPLLHLVSFFSSSPVLSLLLAYLPSPHLIPLSFSLFPIPSPLPICLSFLYFVSLSSLHSLPPHLTRMLCRQCCLHNFVFCSSAQESEWLSSSILKVLGLKSSCILAMELFLTLSSY